MLNVRTRPDIALLVLRLATGFAFFMHGYQKVFTMGVGGITEGFTQMGIPLPGLAAPFISYLELLGGIALMIGILSRVFGFLLACDMLVATVVVHLKNGFLGQGGFELTFLLGCMSLATALAGAGPYSVDAMLAKRRAP